MPKTAPLVLFLLALVISNPASAISQECRQALALGLDVSGSVDMTEYRQQIDGLATALEAPEIREIILATPSAPVAIAIYEWSASSYQQIILPWVVLDTQATLFAATGRLRDWQRGRTPYSTGLGSALEFGSALLSQRPDCARLTLDISGDGKNNTWPRPVLVHNSGVLAGITINALVIGQPPLAVEGQTPSDRASQSLDELETYFRERIIRGPGSFVETAMGFSEYTDAMKRKLLREIATFAIGSTTRN